VWQLLLLLFLLCRCLATSVGPAFVCILGNKYGFRPLPAEIEQLEFDKLLSAVGDNMINRSDEADQTWNPKDANLLREYFHLDLNAVPPKYVLRAATGDAKWSRDFNIIQAQLRGAAENALTQQEAEKYQISVTEAEIRAGIFENEARFTQVSKLTKS